MKLTSKMRNEQRSIAKEIFGDAGFAASRDVFFRKIERNIHRIEIQRSQYGDRYFLNLGWHYDYLPRLRTGEFVNSIADVAYLDCAFQSRLQRLLPTGIWQGSFPYDQHGHMNDRYERVFTECVAYYETTDKIMWEPDKLLTLITPDVLKEHSAYLYESKAGDERFSQVNAILGKWHTSMVFPLACLLSVLARRTGDLVAQREYSAIARDHCGCDAYAHIIKLLRI
jgi:hypothetical protein